MKTCGRHCKRWGEDREMRDLAKTFPRWANHGRCIEKGMGMKALLAVSIGTVAGKPCGQPHWYAPRGGQMNLPRVVNLKVDTCDVVIDRRSKWGNPFRMILKGDGERDRVILRYRAWILKQDALLMAIGELTGKRLGCWCHPKACHGDVLVELFKIANQEESEVSNG